jgi:O-antigen ligase
MTFSLRSIATVATAILLGGLVLILKPDMGGFALLAVSLALAVAWGTWYRSHSWLMFVFAAIVVGQLVRISVSNDTSSAIVLLDIALGAYTLIGLIKILITRAPIQLALPVRFLLLFVVWAAIALLAGSTYLSSNQLLVALFYLIRLIFLVSFIPITMTLFPKTEAQYRVNRAGFLAIVTVIVLGYVQILVVPNFGFMAKFGWDPHSGRMLSTFFDPNFFGMLCVLALGMTMAFLTTQPYGTKPWNRMFGLTLLALGALVLTFSRSSYLAFLICLFVILTIRMWRIVVLAIIILGVIGGSIPRVRTRVLGAVQFDTTARDRIASWKSTLIIVKANPLMGVGYNAFGPAQLRYGTRQNLESHAAGGSDSSLLFILATTGIVGLGLYSMFWLTLWFDALMRYKKHPMHRTVALALLATIPAYVIHSQFVNSLLYPFLFIPFSLFAIALLHAPNKSTAHA